MKRIIKGLIFDYGGVISKPQDKSKVNKIKNKIGIKDNDFVEIYKKFRPDYDKGLINSYDYWINIYDYYGKKYNNSIVKEIIELDILSWINLNNKMLSYVTTIDKSLFKIGLLSNMTFETLNYINKNFHWINYFDLLMYSCNEKASKPENIIYLKCLDKIGLDADECLFIDDSAENIEAANNLGINTIHFNNYYQLLKELKLRFYNF